MSRMNSGKDVLLLHWFPTSQEFPLECSWEGPLGSNVTVYTIVDAHFPSRTLGLFSLLITSDGFGTRGEWRSGSAIGSQRFFCSFLSGSFGDMISDSV
jgi:hypothetical protein